MIKYSYDAGKLLAQYHDNVFVSYRYVQISKLIFEHLDLVNVVQQVVDFLPFVCEKLAANKEDVGQILHIVNVANDFSQVGFCQLESNDEYDILDASLTLLQHFGTRIRR